MINIKIGILILITITISIFLFTYTPNRPTTSNPCKINCPETKCGNPNGCGGICPIKCPNNNKCVNQNCVSDQIEGQFKGVCYFDADGTLTTGKNNAETVQKCIDNGYAVGIITAGGYTYDDNGENDILKYHWVPQNLKDFMKKYKTFNNINTNYLYIQNKRYNSPPKDFPIGSAGKQKGYAMEQGMKQLGTPAQNTLFFDDKTEYLKGVNEFKSFNFPVQCAGNGCYNDSKINYNAGRCKGTCGDNDKCCLSKDLINIL